MLETVQHYARRAVEQPPRVVARKAWHKVRYAAGRPLARWRARLFSTRISPAAFRRALRPEVGGEAGLLQRLHAGDGPAFLVEAARRAETLAALEALAPDGRAATLAAADRARAHVFDLLGSGPVALGDAIDWHCDFKSGHRYPPRAFCGDVPAAAYPGGHDIKVPWELSRCQHFAWLGQAYWLTGDEAYAREFAAQVSDWIAHNPPRLGANWVTAMDAAIRAANWLLGYYYCRESRALDDAFLLALQRSLLEHGRHIRQNLEWSEALTGNHYLSDVVGLVYLGLLCPHFREAAEWLEFGLDAVWREMGKQVYDDGVNFEASISYHRLAAELFLFPVILCDLNRIPVPARVRQRLAAMLEYVAAYTRPDGTAPLFGDCDNGRLHRLKAWPEAQAAREWLDHRYLLALGAVLFERDDFAQAAGDQWEEAAWVFGARALQACHRVAGCQHETASRGFVHGGVYVLGEGGNHLAVDAGPNGQNGNGGHAHCDTLSFEVFAAGRSWVVDPGAYVYTPDYEARNLFRSTRYHNVVVVDGQEQNRFERSVLFSTSDDAQPRVEAWQVSEAGAYLRAAHTGYQRLSPPVHQARVFCYDRQAAAWLIRDEVAAPGAHAFMLYLHLAPVRVEIDGEVVWLSTQPGGPGLALYFLNPPPGRTLTCTTGWVSPSYGCRHEAPVLELSGTFSERLALDWALVPVRAAQAAARADVAARARVAQAAAQAWEA